MSSYRVYYKKNGKVPNTKVEAASEAEAREKFGGQEIVRVELVREHHFHMPDKQPDREPRFKMYVEGKAKGRPNGNSGAGTKQESASEEAAAGSGALGFVLMLVLVGLIGLVVWRAVDHSSVEQGPIAVDRSQAGTPAQIIGQQIELLKITIREHEKTFSVCNTQIEETTGSYKLSRSKINETLEEYRGMPGPMAKDIRAMERQLEEMKANSRENLRKLIQRRQKTKREMLRRRADVAVAESMVIHFRNTEFLSSEGSGGAEMNLDYEVLVRRYQESTGKDVSVSDLLEPEVNTAQTEKEINELLGE
ncbi:MAG: hypothetical protein P8L37_05015 [Phycisphaerales bacterium]|nr:hypothetical protein [Phycisphaerales bacterium]